MLSYNAYFRVISCELMLSNNAYFRVISCELMLSNNAYFRVISCDLMLSNNAYFRGISCELMLQYYKLYFIIIRVKHRKLNGYGEFSKLAPEEEDGETCIAS